jgi:dienelactone hydrolase
MKALPDEEAASKIGEAISFLQNWMMEPEKVGMVAWGSGGTYALRVAAREQRLKAVVVNYGPLSQDSYILSHITSPVLVNVGALDTTTSLERISSFVAAIKIPPRKDVKIYPYAAHSFEDAQSENNYRRDDAADSDRRIKLFLAKWLKSR